MGAMLEDLLKLQNIEKKLAQVRSRLRTRKAAVDAQQRRIDQAQGEVDAIRERILNGRKQADSHDLVLRQRDEEVSKLRVALNTAKTNKEYAAILTQINTLKADNAKREEETLKIMQEVENLKGQLGEIEKTHADEVSRLEEVRASSQEEVQRLTRMMDELTSQRQEAASALNHDTLNVFDRIAGNYDGEAMAPIEIHGKKPPYTYVCGGCYMGLTPEHANALSVRSEIRTCNNCGRILYLDAETARQIQR